MKQFFDAWRRTCQEDTLLTEGLFDIGLPPQVAETINSILEGVPEKGKTIIGNALKSQDLISAFEPYDHTVRTHFGPLFVEVLADTIIDKDDKSQVSKKPDVLEAIHMIASNTAPTIFKQRTVTIPQIIKFFKSLKKSTSKGNIAKTLGGVSDAKIEGLDIQYQMIIDSITSALYSATRDIQHWLQNNKDEYKKLAPLVKKEKPFKAIRDYAEEWVLNDEKEEQILHKFDDGHYWYDLRTSNCSIEARRMGHCGSDGSVDTLISLRLKKPERSGSSSYVTIGYNKSNNSIHQIKGRENQAPDESFWPYIGWLVDNLGVDSIHETGEHSNDPMAFAPMIEWLGENTSAAVDEIEDRWQRLESELELLQTHYNERYANSFISYGMDEDWGNEYPSYHYSGYVGVEIPSSMFVEGELEKMGSFSQETVRRLQGLYSDLNDVFDWVNYEEFSYPTRRKLPNSDHVIFKLNYNANDDGYESYGYGSDESEFDNFGATIDQWDDEGNDINSTLAQELIHKLMSYGFIAGGSFIELFFEVQNEDFDNPGLTTDTDEDYNGNPQEIDIEFEDDVFVDLSLLKPQGFPEFYLDPQAAYKVLQDKQFGTEIRNELVKLTGKKIGDIPLPSTLYYTAHKPDESGKIRIEYGTRLTQEEATASEELVDVYRAILESELDSETLGKIVLIAYANKVNEIFNKETEKSQMSFDFPGGKRLTENKKAKLSYNKMHANFKKWATK